jgi:hypothetical protein
MRARAPAARRGPERHRRIPPTCRGCGLRRDRHRRWNACPGRTNLRVTHANVRPTRKLADSAELRDQLARLLGMVERSGEPRSRRDFSHLQEALHEVRCVEPDYGSPLAGGWRLERSPSLFLCCLRSPARHRTRLPYFRREGSRLDAVMGLAPSKGRRWLSRDRPYSQGRETCGTVRSCSRPGFSWARHRRRGDRIEMRCLFAAVHASAFGTSAP